MSLREAAQQALEAMDSKHDMTKAEWRVLHYRAFTALRDALGADTRTCTCHPDDSPPKPCQRKYALSECLDAALVAAADREPLPDEHLTALCRQHWDRQANILDHIAYARAIEREHDIGSEE